ncbi:hypothetical protein PanWU01x14_223710, partial [Parasponia andersonii]
METSFIACVGQKSCQHSDDASIWVILNNYHWPECRRLWLPNSANVHRKERRR